MSHIAERLQAVRLALSEAAAKVQRRPADIDLLAVSKTFSSDHVAAALAAGQRKFGENYVQEALPKMKALGRDSGIEWHLIGPLQSNKTAAAAASFDWVQSVDRDKIAARLSAARAQALAPLSICVQVNISGESTKSGVHPDLAIALAKSVAMLPGLRLRGLMGIADPDAGDRRIREQFRMLRTLFDALRGEGLDLDTLSMGMSADMEAAIAEGATMVRIGSAIFGARSMEAA